MRLGSIAQISVIIAVHNGWPYIRSAVESVLQQSTESFELLVVDDASDDETGNYLRSLDDRRLEYHRVERMRLVGALNHGLAHARNPLIARLDADDLAVHERLERQCSLFVRSPELVAISSDFERMDMNGDTYETVCNLRTDPAIRFQMLFTTPFLHPGTMFRREAALACGGYRANYDVAEDYDLWTRLGQMGKFANAPEVLTRYRTNPKGVSGKHAARQLSQSSEIAGNYAASLGAGVDALEWTAVHRFLTAGAPAELPPGRMAESFCSLEKAVASGVRDIDGQIEFEQTVARYRTQIRWRLHDEMRRSWRRPLYALECCRAIHRLDPTYSPFRSAIKAVGRRLRGARLDFESKHAG